MIRRFARGIACLVALVSGAACAAAGAVNVSAAVLSKNQCKFSAGTATLAFGTIDPMSPNPTTASTSLTVTCVGSDPIATFTITQDSGKYSTGPGANRMLHAAPLTQYLPYTLSLSPTSASIAKKGSQEITISGSIAASDASNAYAGSYADQVVLTVTP